MRRFVILPWAVAAKLMWFLGEQDAEDLGHGVVVLNQAGFQYLKGLRLFDNFTIEYALGGHELRADSKGYPICEDQPLSAPVAAYLTRRTLDSLPPDGLDGKQPWWWESTIRAWMAGEEAREQS